MSDRYLLDTSAILAHYRKEAGWQTVQELFENHEADIKIAAPSLAEFARRMHALGVNDDDIRLTLESYSLLFDKMIAIDGPVALMAYSLGRQTPDRLPLIDALIAAAALMDKAVLVHRDEHMAVIPSSMVHQLLL